MRRSYGEGGESLALPETQRDRKSRHSREPPVVEKFSWVLLLLLGPAAANFAGTSFSVDHRQILGSAG